MGSKDVCKMDADISVKKAIDKKLDERSRPLPIVQCSIHDNKDNDR